MRDARVAELAGRQFNRIARRQLAAVGLSDNAIAHRVRMGRLCPVHEGVFAVAPVARDDDWGAWMGATLTDEETYLSHVSGGAAWGFCSVARHVETVTRPGTGGPRRHGRLLVYRSSRLTGDTTLLRGVPVTTPERTLLDLAAHLGDRAIARAVREAVRLECTTLDAIGDVLGRHQRRRGSRRLAQALARYSGLPLARARSASEIRAMELLRQDGRPLPQLNVRIAGEEADLSWPEHRLIIEIDGGPFHLDVGEDARKQRRWEGGGWRVIRIPAELVYEQPQILLTAAPTASNVPEHPA